MRKLNMWHRLGVVLTLGWLISATAYVAIPWYLRASNAGEASGSACLSAQAEARKDLHNTPPLTADRGKLTLAEFEELERLTAEVRQVANNQLARDCFRERAEARDRVARGLWAELLIKVLLPVLLGWLLAYIAIWTGRWIVAGRQVTKSDEDLATGTNAYSP